MKDERKQLESDLVQEYEHWNYIHEHGCQDPFYADGFNLNLTRNHIIFKKQRCNKLEFYPDVYKRELPQEVDEDYMARAGYIREQAKKTLQLYVQHDDYKWLRNNANRLTMKQKDDTCIMNVLNYVTGLRQFIESDMLVEMRRHIDPDRYIESFVQCRKRVEAIFNYGNTEKQNIVSRIDEKDQLAGQMNIFDFIGG